MEGKSKSGIKIVECKYCNKSKSSKSRGVFYAQTIRVNNILTLLLSCSTCKGAIPIPIVEENKAVIRMRTGLIYHCFNLLHKVTETKDSVFLECTKCGFKQKFERLKK